MSVDGGVLMTSETFNIVASFGIGLTFLASIAAVFVSLLSLKNAKLLTKYTGGVSTISPARERWQISLRENASSYFMMVNKLCSNYEHNWQTELSEFTRLHFEISFLIFKQDTRLQGYLNRIRNVIDEIANLHQATKAANSKDCRQKLSDLQKQTSDDLLPQVFDMIQKLIEDEWRKMQRETKI